METNMGYNGIDDKRGYVFLLVILAVVLLIISGSAFGDAFKPSCDYVVCDTVIGTYNKEDAMLLVRYAVEGDEDGFHKMQKMKRTRVLPAGTKVKYVATDVGFGVVKVAGEPSCVYIPLEVLREQHNNN